VDRIIRDLKSCALGIREFDWAELEIVEIGDAMAAETHQVMVMLRIAVETGHSLRVVRPADDAELNQRLEHSINRGPGDPRNAASNIFEELICRGMIFAIEHGFEDNSPLYRLRQALSAAEFLELDHLLLFEC
jgi:hypothetical protein